DGWATLDPLPAQDLTVEAYLWGVLVAKLTLIWDANYTGDLVLEHVPCRVYDLRVRVVDENGNPIAGADVSLVWPNETGIMTKPTGPDGWAVFENVPAGPYKLKVSKEGYEITWSDVALSREDQEHVVTLRLAAQAVISPWLVIAVGAVIGVAALLGVIVLARRRAAKGA
ncbi:MAG TPA: carboxypeptidase regulatory-like domain-containing protein, partial [Candidatus Bathyarchaeota archaeon]|nr:carboxypeptidase regulatory-like domain-containing protein [Candidatus Bathyarchaeota archaeon]